MKKVLFVCTGNTCRSPMAELIFNSLAAERGIDAHADSAGLCTVDGLEINTNAKKALEEIGVSSGCFRSADIYSLDLKEYGVLAAMTPEHLKELAHMGVDEKRLYLLGEKGKGINDPYGLSLEVYRMCRDEIANSVEKLIKAL